MREDGRGHVCARRGRAGGREGERVRASASECERARKKGDKWLPTAANGCQGLGRDAGRSGRKRVCEGKFGEVTASAGEVAGRAAGETKCLQWRSKRQTRPRGQQACKLQRRRVRRSTPRTGGQRRVGGDGWKRLGRRLSGAACRGRCWRRWPAAGRQTRRFRASTPGASPTRPRRAVLRPPRRAALSLIRQHASA